MTNDDRTRPPDSVPGDDAQPSNQPIEEQVRTVPLDEGDGGEAPVVQENTGPGNMDGGGEWPDPDAPARGPAPGTAAGGADAVSQQRRPEEAGEPGGTGTQPQLLQDGGANQNVGPARSSEVDSGNQRAVDPPTGCKDALEDDRVAGGSSSVPDEE